MPQPIEAKVAAIFISPEMGNLKKPVPMESRDLVVAIAGKGLEGDRYAAGKGAYSKPEGDKIRHVSLIAAEAIDAANAEHRTQFEAEDTRRNIVTSGVDLNSLVGQEFSVGGVRMRGTELCDPCPRPSNLARKAGRGEGREGFREAFENRGGLRAEIIESGEIIVGAPIEVFNTH